MIYSNKWHRLLFWLFSTASFTNAAAQQHTQPSDTGLVIYTLGADTTMVQYFQYDDHHIKTTILDLNGTVRKYEGLGLLDEMGDIREVRTKAYRLDSTGNWALIMEGDNLVVGDSTVYTVVQPGKTIRRKALAGKAIVSNAADPCSYYMFPFMGFFAGRTLKDTLFHCHFVFGECRMYYVTRISQEEWHVGSRVMGTVQLFAGEDGRMDSLNAIGSTLNLIGRVNRDGSDYSGNIDQLAKIKWANHSSAKPMMRDSARLVVSDKLITVNYWSPLTRGRQIFGNVVPWNRIWRTGANNATKLHSAIALQYEGQTLPAGEYSLWTYPTEKGWWLVINKKANVWGTEYDSTADAIKLPLHVEEVGGKIEALKIDLLMPTPSVIRLQIAWDHYRASADFRPEPTP
jgi:hypothetical protein